MIAAKCLNTMRISSDLLVSDPSRSTTYELCAPTSKLTAPKVLPTVSKYISGSRKRIAETPAILFK